MSAKKILFTVVFLIVLLQLALSLKVRERFKFIPTNKSVVMAVGKVIPEDMKMGGFSISELLELFKGFRIIMKECGSAGTGTADSATGQYDGFIGCVQQGQVDTMASVVRADSLPFEPGKVVTFCSLADVPKIYTMRSSRMEMEQGDILHLWSTFDEEIWTDILLSFILFTVIRILINYYFLKRLQVFKQVRFFLWEYFGLSVKQCELVRSPYLALAILTMSISLATFYGYHLVLMNTLSSDLSVPVLTRSLESLHELIHDQKFVNITPVVTTAMSMYNVLKSSRHGTDPHLLFVRINKNKKKSVKEFAFSNVDVMATVGDSFGEVLNDASKGESVVIENSDFIKLLIKAMYCNLDPNGTSLVREVDDVFLPSALSLLVNKNFSATHMPLFEYRVLTMGEFGILKGLIDVKLPKLLEEMQGPRKVKGIVCSEKISGIYKEDLELSWQPFKLEPFERLILICFYVVVLSFFILIIEIIVNSFKKLFFKKRKRRHRGKRLKRINEFNNPSNTQTHSPSPSEIANQNSNNIEQRLFSRTNSSSALPGSMPEPVTRNNSPDRGMVACKSY